MFGSCKPILYLVLELLDGEVFKVFLHSFGLYQYYYCKQSGKASEEKLLGWVYIGMTNQFQI